ncbi:hypothetical protein LEP1GSC047_4271 [Leptospira inadai serovar Lyme str. 10]|uniref:Uncharacterized protein n=1 Tax=Leptospira inadai serovar Lyme str. 10 TaxID=1049790 RepID=V6HKH5_9LEPT|nr:hypothetical protein LEP1GSC047_4271 [Leptospira inadai serovar Lyme str. 10]
MRVGENFKTEYYEIDFGRLAYLHFQKAVYLNQAEGPRNPRSRQGVASPYLES